MEVTLFFYFEKDEVASKHAGKQQIYRRNDGHPTRSSFLVWCMGIVLKSIHNTSFFVPNVRKN
jgi:hypothetical protein